MTAAGKLTLTRSQQGISLIEQIMVLAIVAILAGVALPPLRRLMGRSRLQSAQTDFIAALQHARSSAAFSGKRSLFCPSLDGRHCSENAVWDDGWLLGHDTDGDHQPDGEPSYTGAAYPAGLRITSSSGRHDVRFRADGSAYGSNLTLLFCEPGNSALALTVVVSNSGRVRGAPATSAQAAHCAQSK